MNKLCILLGLLIIAGFTPLPAQEPFFDWDFDTLFDEPPEEAPREGTSAGSDELDLLSVIRQRVFSVDASYSFIGGVVPGWSEPPWYSNDDTDFSWTPTLRMRVTFGLNAQISEVFRVRNTVFFQIPGFEFHLGDFFFDYNLNNVVFFRGGKYDLAWGISPNFSFTNLLARIPNDSYARDSFILKADIPVGIGGFQFLALTRANLMSDQALERKDLGYGAKFNLALPQIDIDLGGFTQLEMPHRGFLSIKTTLGDTELYNEWMIAAKDPKLENAFGAANIGFLRDFFGSRLTVNGEVFYNAERATYWYRPETEILESEVSPFVEGFNLALNLLYRFGGRGNFRTFVQALYAPEQESARLVPGFTLNPWQHIEFYFAVPMALGSKEGYYYNNTIDLHNRPFSVIFLITLSGSIRSGTY